MTSFTRRDLIKGAALLPLGLASAGFGSGPSATFPTEPRSRVAVATYPFRKSILAPGNQDRDASLPGMDLAAFALFIRKEFDVGGIEPLDSHFTSTDRVEIMKLRSAFDTAGVKVVNIPVDASVDLCSGDKAARDAGNATYRHWIDIASILGSPSVRFWIPKCSEPSDLPKAVRAMKPTLDYAADHNIVVNLENDDPVLSSATRVLAAIHLADTPYLRALPDFGNALMGGDAQFNAEAVRSMFARAWNIAHVKDAEVIRGKRETVSLAQLFAIAKAAKFRGYYSMESDSDVDPLADTRHLIERTLAHM